MSTSSEARRIDDEIAEQVITLPKHLHARPAGEVAQAAARLPQTSIELAAGGRRANARSVLAVMGLGAVTGTEVLVSAAGPGAAVAVYEICRILAAPETED